MIINNIIQNVLKQNDKDAKLNIVSTHCENKQFLRFLKKICGGSVLDIDNTTYSHIPISLVVCNNKTEYLNKCLSICQYFHAPLLIVEHKEKPDFVNIYKIQKPLITNIQVALNNRVAQSWNSEDFHHVIDFDITSHKNIKRWKEIVLGLSSATFKFYPEQEHEQQ